MAIVNSLLNVKDSRWLQLEVCREFQRNKCTRPDSECKFAHPAVNVEIQNGRVIACYDSIKGRCNREKPPCKYFHPPKHLKDQLIINGKNHLALKNALLQQVPFQTVLAGQLPIVGSVANLLNAYPRNAPTASGANSHPYSVAAYALNGQTLIANSSAPKAPSPYLTNLPAIAAASSAAAYGAYTTPSHNAMLLNHDQFPSSYGLNSPSPTTSSAVSSPSANNKARADASIGSNSNGASIESHVLAEASSLNAVANVAAAAAAAGRKRNRETNDELLMQISGAYPITKRPALDKNGAPLYHGATAAAAYPQPFAMHQPFVPLSFYFPLVGQSNTIPRY